MTPVKITVIIILSIIATCSGCLKEQEQAERDQARVTSSMGIDLPSLVSVQMPGWRVARSAIIAEPDDMRRYSGRFADLYFSYGFKRLAAKEYKNTKSLSILVEAYEFDTSENAYGAYSFDAVGNKLDVGQEGIYGHGILKFWKDNLLVRVIAEEDYQELEKDIIAFAKEVDSRIPTTGPKPELLNLIPQGRIVPGNLHFFHEDICLNNIYYIPESDRLRLSKQTNVVSAKYALGGDQFPRLILIEYPDEFIAQTAFDAFRTSYIQAQMFVSRERSVTVVRNDEGEYEAIAKSRNFLILIFESKSADSCKRLVEAALERIESGIQVS